MTRTGLTLTCIVLVLTACSGGPTSAAPDIAASAQVLADTMLRQTLEAQTALAPRAPTPSPTPPAISITVPPEGLIAYVQDRGTSNPEIYVMRPDGSQRTRLTYNRCYYDADPAWSPDATKIAYVSCDGNAAGLYVMNLKDGAITRLTGGFSVSDPVWSPDGTTIAFTDSGRDPDHVWGIYLIRSDGSDLHRAFDLVRGGGQDAFSWAPNGRYFLDSSGMTPRGDECIRIVETDTGAWQCVVTLGYPGPAGAVYSPLGDRIAYVRISSDNLGLKGQFGQELYIAQGGEIVRLTYNQSYDFHPSWSPDGMRLVFEESTPVDSPVIRESIFVINANGTGQINITADLDRDASDPTWSPAGVPAP
jgi:Tol biopolymer transport system component